VTFRHGSGIITAVPRLPRPPFSSPVSGPDVSRALRRAGTPRGQLAGVSLIVVPAVTSALPLGGASRTVVQVVAVLLGTAGMVVVFGGLLQRAVLGRVTDDEADPVDAALLAFPHARAAWRSLAALAVLLLAGALWCVGLAFGDDAGTHLTDALMLALPGLVLAAATWRARVMRRAGQEPGDGESGGQDSADPDFHLDQETFQS
jgi:hypothetical protein